MSVTSCLKDDLQANTLHERPRLLDYFLAWVLNAGFVVVTLSRLAIKWRHHKGIKRLISRLAQRHVVRGFGCYISPLAKIGKGLGLPHPVGIVIGDGVVIGEDVTIYQHVTLGRAKHQIAEYPHIEDGAVIYSGAVILGPVTIGKGAIIGANSVVTKDVPPHSIAFGAPASVRS